MKIDAKRDNEALLALEEDEYFRCKHPSVPLSLSLSSPTLSVDSQSQEIVNSHSVDRVDPNKDTDEQSRAHHHTTALERPSRPESKRKSSVRSMSKNVKVGVLMTNSSPISIR